MEPCILLLEKIVSLRDELMDSTEGEFVRECSKTGMYVIMGNIMQNIGDHLEMR